MPRFRNDELLDFWRFQQTGLFYQRTCLRPTAMKNRDGSIVPVADLQGVAVYFGEAIDCLIRRVWLSCWTFRREYVKTDCQIVT